MEQNPYPTSFKVAAIEFNPDFLNLESNLTKMLLPIEEAAKNGAKLIVLPEMATTGYIYQDREQITPYLDVVPGKTTTALAPLAKQYHIYIVVGLAERDVLTNLVYNSAVLIGPEGYIGTYRKNYLNPDDQLWASPGNLGFPVFETELGKIALLICYDDTYMHSFLIPALRGANIIAYLTASDRRPLHAPGSQFNHATIASIVTIPGWVGTYIIASSRTGKERNPANNHIADYLGAASIWDPEGSILALAPTSTDESSLSRIIYADVQTVAYDNQGKKIIEQRRRPELYQIFNLYRSPIDSNASNKSYKVKALLVQYTPQPGDVQANLKKITMLIEHAIKKHSNLILLPECSLIGSVEPEHMKQYAEDLEGETITQLSRLAKQYHCYIGFSLPQSKEGKYYATAVLLDDEGNIVGLYHKTHLNEVEKKWATAGNVLPVFTTKIGRIGFMIGDEVLIPDIAHVLAMQRADIILIPTAWSGEYGQEVNVEPALLIKPYPRNTMTFWYNIAKFSQTYTLVCNYVWGEKKYKGCSGLYSLNPIQGHYPPITEQNNIEVAFTVDFVTRGEMDWWMNQHYLIAGQRVELNLPLTLDDQTPWFKEWKAKSTQVNFHSIEK